MRFYNFLALIARLILVSVLSLHRDKAVQIASAAQYAVGAYAAHGYTVTVLQGT